MTITEDVKSEWCQKCGCGNDVRGYAHLPQCNDTSDHLEQPITHGGQDDPFEAVYCKVIGADSVNGLHCCDNFKDFKARILAAWEPIATAPKDRRVLVWTGLEIFAANWVKNPYTNDEAWVVARWGTNGDQALVQATHWMQLPMPPMPPTQPEIE